MTTPEAKTDPRVTKSGWVDMVSLNDIFRSEDGTVRQFTNEDAARIAATALPVVRRWAREVIAADHLWKHGEFTRSVARRVDNGRELTEAQLRGILNVIAGQIKAQRRLAWDNPYAEARRQRGWYECGSCGCIVCGDLLTTAIDRARGAGRTCWGNVVAAKGQGR